MLKVSTPQPPYPQTAAKRSYRYRKPAAVSAAAASLAAALCAGGLAAQAQQAPPGAPNPGLDTTFNSTAGRVFNARCVSCHGPARQEGGLRLDSREGFLSGGAHGPVVVPGKHEDSRLYQLIATGKMPLDGPLSILEVENITTWIDAGAAWPQRKRPVTTNPDRRVEAWKTALRGGDKAAAARLLREPGFASAKGAGGRMPLHYAALYGGIDTLKSVLDAGAPIDGRDDKGVTPLLLAVTDEAKARLLIERGADIAANSDDGTSPLMVAVAQGQDVPLVRLLLAKGAKVEPYQVQAMTGVVADSGNPDVYRALYPKALPANGPAAMLPAGLAVAQRCRDCLEAMIAAGAKGLDLAIAVPTAAMAQDVESLKRVIALGAPLNGPAPHGDTALMAAVNADHHAEEMTRILLDAGADPNIATPDGRTALWYAQRSHPELVPLLKSKGAK